MVNKNLFQNVVFRHLIFSFAFAIFFLTASITYGARKNPPQNPPSPPPPPPAPLTNTLLDTDLDGVSDIIEAIRGTNPSVYDKSAERSLFISLKGIDATDVLNNLTERANFINFCKAPNGIAQAAISKVVIAPGYNGLGSISPDDTKLAQFIRDVHAEGIYVAVLTWSPDCIEELGDPNSLDGWEVAQIMLSLRLNYNLSRPVEERFDEIATDIEPNAYTSPTLTWTNPSHQAVIWTRYLNRLEYVTAQIQSYNDANDPDISHSEYIFSFYDDDDSTVSNVNDIVDRVAKINLMAYSDNISVLQQMCQTEIDYANLRNKKSAITVGMFPIGFDGLHRRHTFYDDGATQLESAISSLKTTFDSSSSLTGFGIFLYPYYKTSGVRGVARTLNLLYLPGNTYHTDIFNTTVQDEIIWFCYRPYASTGYKDALSIVKLATGWNGTSSITGKDAQLPALIEKFHDPGQSMKFYLSMGANNWLNDADWNMAKLLIDTVFNYNNTHTPAQRIDGIVTNIAPTTHPSWASNQSTLWSKYLNRLQYIRAKIDAYNAVNTHKMKFGDVIQSYYDTDTSNISNYQDPVGIVDFVEVQGFFDNAGIIISAVSNELNYCASVNKPAVVAINVKYVLGGNQYTYFDNGKAYMEIDLTAISNYFQGLYPFSGYSFEYYKSYKEMKD